jgi:hypothetical protein
MDEVTVEDESHVVEELRFAPFAGFGDGVSRLTPRCTPAACARTNGRDLRPSTRKIDNASAPGTLLGWLILLALRI